MTAAVRPALPPPPAPHTHREQEPELEAKASPLQRQGGGSTANSDISHMQGGAYVSIYLHPIDYAEFLIRQAEEAEADSKIQVKKIGINQLRNTSKPGRLEQRLLSLTRGTPSLRKHGRDPCNCPNILIPVENTQERVFP